MNPRRCAAVLPLLLAFASPALAQGGDVEARVLESVRSIQERVSEMRGLSYQAPVKAAVHDHDQLAAMLLESFEEEASIEEMAAQERVIKAFGLIPQDYDLRQRMIEFLVENIGGYYDPEAKELFLIDQSSNEEMQGMPGPAQEAMQEMVMAHELHHALQDQNFDLSRWMEVVGDHEDRLQGFKSLVEGEAQLIGMTYLFAKMGQPNIDMRQINRMQEMQMQMGGPEVERMRAIPPYLLENMMFPYTQGAEFVQAMQRAGGWDRVSAAFWDPPTSTEQILHPNKFLGDVRDEPTELEFRNLMAPLAEGAEELYANTMGEFNVSIMLRALGVSKAKAARAAAGWDGDSFAGFGIGERVVVVWLTTWDSEAEASEFESTYREALAGFHPDAYLERRGTEVLLVDGAASDEQAGLVARGFQAVKVTLTFEPIPSFTETPPRSDFTPEEETSKPRLYQLDHLGVALELPAGFEETREPLQSVENLPGSHMEDDHGRHIRLLALPVPYDQALQQIEATFRQGVQGFTVERREEAVVGDRRATRVTFLGTIPGDVGSTRTHAMILPLDEWRTLMVACTAPEGHDAAMGEGLLEGALSSLDIQVPMNPAQGSQPEREPTPAQPQQEPERRLY